MDTINTRHIMPLIIAIVLTLTLLSLPVSPLIKISVSFLFLISVILRKKMYYLLLGSPLLLISFLPSQYVSIFRFNSALGELRTVFILVPILIIFVLVVRGFKIDFGVMRKDVGVWIPLLLLFLSGIATTLHVGNTTSNFRYSLFTFVMGFGVLLCVYLFRGLIDPYKMIKLSIVVSAVVASIGLLELVGVQPYASYYLIDSPWYNYDNRVLDGLPRIVSSIGNPLVFSGYLLMFLPFTLYVREKEKKKLWWNLIIMLHVLAIIFTVSRSAILVMTVILLFHLSKTMNPIKITGIIIAGTLLMLVVYMVLDQYGLSSAFVDRLLFKTEAESYSIRAYAYSIFMDIVTNNFFFGVGTDVSSYLIKYGEVGIRTLDNIFLTVFAGFGFLGIIFFSFPLLKLGKKYALMKGIDRLTGLSTIIVFLGMGLSYNFMYFEATWSIFWFMSGLFSLHLNTNDRNKGA